MGISADQFWAGSQNGKAMMAFLARQEKYGIGNNVEIVRDICDWLVVKHREDLKAGAMQKGATFEQAKTLANTQTEGLKNAVEGIHDRNVEGVSTQVIDAVFRRHYNAGPKQYAAAMQWFANELRVRLKDK